MASINKKIKNLLDIWIRIIIMCVYELNQNIHDH